MSEGPKAALLEEFALVASALAAPARLRLLESLAQGERGVDGLADKTGLTGANCSQHLQQLRRAGLVTSRRDGKAVIYRLTDPATLRLLDLLHRVAARNLGRAGQILRDLAGEDDPPEPMRREELQALLDQGAVTLLDLRPADEYAAGHIPGARNVTPERLAALLPDLDPGGRIVAYCRGPYCIFAHQAVAALRRAGLDARRMEGGLPDWRADGRAVAAA